MKKIYLLALLTVSAFLQAYAQDATVPLNEDVYRLIDRYHIKYNTENLHTSFKPYGRARVATLAETAQQNLDEKSPEDQYNIQYLINDNWNYTRYDRDNLSRRPFLKYFYENQTDFYHYESPEFSLRVNPVIGLLAGEDNQTDGLRSINSRGVQVEGTIDERLGFYTFLAENQVFFPGWVNNRIARDTIVPHEAYWKPFKDGGYDFFSARGYVNYAATKHISVMLGHDRHFIGNGFRSLILSDYSAPYFFLKLQTQVWKLQYTNLFAELTADHESRDQLYPKKYMALHHLSVNLLPNLNVGVFESTIFGRNYGRFELQYLNPIIFYRAIEQALGSEDNAILGADFKWNIYNRVQLYGQFVLDEFLLSEIKAGNGWWGNKYALQGGAKYIDAFNVSNLDLQGEINIVRPFTYQHESASTNFQHYQQPLAHPMGANLAEAIAIVRYQPLPKLTLTAKAIATRYGQDPEPRNNESNFGGNVLKPYTTRNGEYGHNIGNGVKTDQLYGEATLSYQLKYNMFIDATQIVRNAKAEDPAFDHNTTFTALSFRWNIPQRSHAF
ncbi:hypothetical protein [Rufibacter roseus]|uniref:Capsule assembly Wzi family protein n=1 Tax=Rufibacter roseus TaxID=1567108 RepID=A0ABW2DIK2_9BACT|nr:hypothetical protein [Rufibacter roseus]